MICVVIWVYILHGTLHMFSTWGVSTLVYQLICYISSIVVPIILYREAASSRHSELRPFEEISRRTSFPVAGGP